MNILCKDNCNVLLDLSTTKNLPEAFLRSTGIEATKYAGRPAIAIPYHDRNNEFVHHRYRMTDDSNSPRFRSEAGSKNIPYGRQFLDKWDPKYLLLVEGESDCWTAWYHNIPCLGIPGATNYTCLTKEDVEGFETVYIWEEPDKAGERFLTGSAAHLETIGYRGHIKRVSTQHINERHCKDLSDHQVHNSVQSKLPNSWKHIRKFAKDIELKESEQATSQANSTIPQQGMGKRILSKYIKEAAVGERNICGFDLACQLRDNGFSKSEALLLMEHYQAAVDTEPFNPYTTDEMTASLEQAYSESPRDAWHQEYALTDLGNAERFRDTHKESIRWVNGWGWLAWDGTRWLRNAESSVYQMAGNAIKDMGKQAWDMTDEDKRQRSLKWAIQSQNKTRIEAMATLSKNLDGIHTEHNVFDQQKYLLNTHSGVIDLRRGILLPHHSDNLITKICGATYSHTAEAPLWESFLHQIMDGNEDLISFLQRAVGYSATGETSERVLFLLHGSGANGKSVFLDVLGHVLGDYSSTIASESLMNHGNSKGSEASPDVARLCGIRMASSSESSRGSYMSEAKVKLLTGCDTVVARHLYKAPFEFKPEFSLWLATNYLPKVEEVSDAIWDRIRLIPFLVRIPSAERDRRLAEKLKGESEGILRWIVEGATEWYQHGLKPPKEVLLATQDYREEMDAFGEFLSSVCDLSDSTAETAASILLRRYNEWATQNEQYEITSRELSDHLSEHGIRKRRKSNGIHYMGIRA